MMQHYNLTKIMEEPARVLVHRKPRIAPVIDAERSQDAQRENRFSLRRMK